MAERAKITNPDAELNISLMICNSGCLKVYPAELAPIKTNVIASFKFQAYILYITLCLFKYLEGWKNEGSVVERQFPLC